MQTLRRRALRDALLPFFVLLVGVGCDASSKAGSGATTLGDASEISEGADADSADTAPEPDGSAGADGGDTSGSGGADAASDTAPDEAAEVAAVFERSDLLEVAISLPEADWDALRVEGRTGLNQFGADCLDAPDPSPYTWKEAAVSLDGAAFERVGIRKKGFFGSLDNEKPSLLLDLDKNVDGQSWHTLERLTFNNNKQDDAVVRTCLAYAVFRAAGVPAPRCNYAHVTVNGRDLGVYTHVESVRKSFLRLRFEDDEGWLYEGTLSDFREPYDGTFDQKTNESVLYRAPIARLMTAAAAPDDQLLSALDSAMDLEGFYPFWAAEVLTAHWDGYTGDTNNFFVYAGASDERLRFIPWGPDGTFRRPYLLFEDALAPRSVFATGIIARRLYLHPEAQRRFREELALQLDTVWDEQALAAQVAADAARIRPFLSADEATRQAADQTQLLDFLNRQRAFVSAELRGAAPSWDFELRDSICLTPAGQIAGTFSTTLGTHPAADAFQTGTGTFGGVFDGQAILPTAVGASAGVEAPDAILTMPVFTEPDSVTFLYLRFPIAAIPAPGTPIPSEEGVTAYYGIYDAATDSSDLLAYGYRGSVTLTSDARRNGDPVTGSFGFELWR